MRRIAMSPDEFARPAEVLGWAGGVAFTFILFFGMAHFENSGAAPVTDAIEDLRTFSVPLSPPPPPPRTVEPQTPVESVPFSGLDVGASESAVKIAVVPPDLELLVPSTREPPRVMAQLGLLPVDHKLRVNVDADLNRIYQVSEVDQRPHAIVRIAPPVPGELFNRTQVLRVELLLLIDTRGRALSARIVRSSGSAEFDNITAQTVQERWEFSPAVRRGKKVKCLAQQAVRVTLGGGTPFSIE